MPRIKDYSKDNCPFCRESILLEQMEEHLNTCMPKQERITDTALRNYIIKHVVHKHPRCPICNHRFVTAMTKAIINGDSYTSIVKQYSGKMTTPTFTSRDLELHKAHLNINLATIINKNREKNRALSLTTCSTPFNKAGLISAITGAVMERDQKLTSLELTQVAKLNVAKKLYEEIQDSYEHNVAHNYAKRHPLLEGEMYPEGEEPPTYPISNDAIRDMEGMFLKYMESVGELQVKILKFYENLGGNGRLNVNSEVILTVIQNMELAVLQHLSKTVMGADIRLVITAGVGEIFNKANEELNKLLMQEQGRMVNPVDVAYEEVKNSIFNTMGTLNGK